MIQTMKKVLVVTPLFPSEERPYYCIYLLQLFDALRQLGHSVDILMPDSTLPDGGIARSQYRDFNLIHVGHNNKLPHEVAGKMTRGFARSAKKIISELNPDIIDLNLCSTATSKFLISLAKKMGIPVVMHYHGLNVFYNYSAAHPLLEKILAWGKLWIADHADAIVGVSDKVGEIVRKKSKNEAVYTVYNGVDADLFYPATEKHNEIFTIICVANLIPIKGHEFLLRAAHDVLFNHGHKLKIQIIGAGPEKDKLQDLAKELDIAGMVEFQNEINYERVAQKVRKADFFIMPSYFESLGCVYLEAMASGVAALGVKGCGIDEIITDKVNGYIVQPKNEEEIAQRILFALENPDKHEQIAQKGYKTVLNKYLWKDAAYALDTVYSELLDRRTENA